MVSERNAVCNVVWLTGDVHYTAAHFYDPAKAQFSDFGPFWEFVSGPLNAGTFGPSFLDNTFGIQVVYKKYPDPGRINLPPSALLQFFGQVLIEGRTGNLTPPRRLTSLACSCWTRRVATLKMLCLLQLCGTADIGNSALQHPL